MMMIVMVMAIVIMILAMLRLQSISHDVGYDVDRDCGRDRVDGDDDTNEGAMPRRDEEGGSSLEPTNDTPVIVGP